MKGEFRLTPHSEKFYTEKFRTLLLLLLLLLNQDSNNWNNQDLQISYPKLLKPNPKNKTMPSRVNAGHVNIVFSGCIFQQLLNYCTKLSPKIDLPEMTKI